MDMKTILLWVIVILVIYCVYYFYFRDTTTVNLATMHNARVAKVIAADKLPGGAGTNDFTYSVWVYVNNWNYQYGKRKIILRRINKANEVCPMISLGATTNDLECTLATYSGAEASSSQEDTCPVKNIPLQKWVHILLTTQTRSVDVYIDGKLVKTCLLQGVAKLDSSAPLDVCPDGGFSGFIAKLRYYARSVNPREAYDIYREGFSDSFSNSAASKYKVKLSFFHDNNEINSIAF